jgi:low affinity Fe/Cu permease
MANGHHQSLIQRIGCAISSRVSDIAAEPTAQIGLIAICIAWFWIGLGTDLLTAVLSIMAITLTQMVLNRQNEREAEDHRRDIAMHAKLDELISATKRARNEFVGVEERDEEEIVQLKDEVREALEDAPADPRVRETAEKALNEATEEVKKELRRKRTAAKSPEKAAASVRR